MEIKKDRRGCRSFLMRWGLDQGAVDPLAAGASDIAGASLEAGSELGTGATGPMLL
jgi:hypothetical protein